MLTRKLENKCTNFKIRILFNYSRVILKIWAQEWPTISKKRTLTIISGLFRLQDRIESKFFWKITTKKTLD